MKYMSLSAWSCVCKPQLAKRTQESTLGTFSWLVGKPEIILLVDAHYFGGHITSTAITVDGGHVLSF